MQRTANSTNPYSLNQPQSASGNYPSQCCKRHRRTPQVTMLENNTIWSKPNNQRNSANKDAEVSGSSFTGRRKCFPLVTRYSFTPAAR